MARLTRLAAALGLAGLATAAHADPVSIIGGLASLAGASAAGVTLSAIAFAGISYGSLIFAAGSLVFGTLNARRKQRQASAAARDQANANVQERMVTALSTASPWQIIYGQAEVGGSLEAILTSGDRDEFKHLVIVLAAHECEEIVDIKIAGVSIGALDGLGFVTTGKWIKTNTKVYSETLMFDAGGEATISRVGATLLKVIQLSAGPGVGDSFDGTPEVVYGSAALVGTTVSGGPVSEYGVVSYTVADDTSMVRVQKHLGADDQLADATLLAECPDQWSATDRLRGLTYVVVRLNLIEPEFQGGPPAITFDTKGKKLYDHRTGLTVYSDNNALCTADYLMAPYGKDARTNQLVWSTFDAAANACDEDIGGGMRRFTCNGAFKTDQDTDRVLEDLLGSMAGWADCSGGWRIGAGVWTAPVTTITDDDNAGPVQIVGGAGLDEVFNGVRGQFNDPERFGVATDFPPYQNASFVDADGRELWSDLPLPFTNEAQRATNLARIFTEQARGETLSYPAKMAVVNRVKVGERLVLENPTLGISTVTFRLAKREEVPGGTLLLTLQQDVEESYDLADAVTPIPASSTSSADVFVVPAVTGLAAVSGEEYAVVTATSVMPRVLVSVTGQPQFLTDQLQLEWRTSATDTWQALAVPAGQTTAFIENVNQGVTYFVRARWYRPSVGAAGDWRVVMATGTGKTRLPGAVTGLAAVGIEHGIRISGTLPADGELAYVEVWMSADNVLAHATRITWGLAATYDQLGLSAADGIKYFWVRCVDTSRNQGAFTGPVSATAGITALPGAVTGLAATAIIGGIRISGTLPLDADLAYVEIWMGTTNVLGAAARITWGLASKYDQLGLLPTDGARYFWVRCVNTSGTTGAFVGPVSATAGTAAAGNIGVSSLSAISANAGTITSGTLGGAASVNVTGNVVLEGVFTGGLFSTSMLVNSLGNAVNGLVAHAPGGLLGAALRGVGAGSSAYGVLGASNGLNGVLGTSASGSSAGIYAGNTGGGPSFECNTNYKWGSYTYSAPGGSAVLCLHGDGVWRDPVTTARVNAAFGASLSALALVGHNHAGVYAPAASTTWLGNTGTADSSGGMNVVMSTGLAPTYQVRGSGNVLYLETASDRRLKQDIEDETYGIAFINALRPRRFRFISDTEYQQHGFIAQEVAALATPNGEKDALAFTNPSGMMGINHLSVIGILTKAVQELHAELQELKTGRS
jgi:DNA-dependent RNA polymerase auxiliary subunit epsilon